LKTTKRIVVAHNFDNHCIFSIQPGQTIRIVAHNFDTNPNPNTNNEFSSNPIQLEHNCTPHAN